MSRGMRFQNYRSLISVNYDVCEKILQSKKHRNVTDTVIHGKPMNEVLKEVGNKTESDKKVQQQEIEVKNLTKKKKYKKTHTHKAQYKKQDKDIEANKTHQKKVKTMSAQKTEDATTSLYKEMEKKTAEFPNTGLDITETPVSRIIENETGTGAILGDDAESGYASESKNRQRINDVSDDITKRENKTIRTEAVHSESFWEMTVKKNNNIQEVYAKEKQNEHKYQENINENFSYMKAKTEMQTKGKTTIFNETYYNKFMHALKQQQLKKNSKLHYFYEWKTAVIILSVCSVLFVLIGIYIYVESKYVVEAYIPYTSNDTDKTFQVSSPMKKPVYVYYKISNYFSNFKGYVSDQSNHIISESKCTYIRTLEDLYKYRCINGKQTLPELQKHVNTKKNIENDKIQNEEFTNLDEGDNIAKKERTKKRDADTCAINSLDPELKNKEVYPCGLIGASIFNDEIELSQDGKQLKIEKLDSVKHFDFFTYSRKNNLTEYANWFYAYSTTYRNWAHTPMTSSFIKLYGIVNEDLEQGINYKLIFSQNTWPSEFWKAKKGFVFVSLRWIGNSSTKLAYIYFIIAFIYIILIIFIIVLVKCKYYKPGKTFSFCQTSIPANSGDVAFLAKTSKDQLSSYDQTKLESTKNQDSDGGNEHPKFNPMNVERISCPCPLH